MLWNVSVVLHPKACSKNDVKNKTTSQTSEQKYSWIRLTSNSVNSNTPLFRTQNHFRPQDLLSDISNSRYFEQFTYYDCINKNLQQSLSCPFFYPKLDGYSSPRSIHYNICSSQISTDLITPEQLLDSRSWHTQKDSTERYTFHVNCRTFDCKSE